AFLAGDDLMLPGKIRAQVDWFEADASRTLCAHDVEHFDSDSGKRIKLHSSISPLRSGHGVAEYLRTHYFSATSSIMVRSTAIPKRGFDERIRVHSDWKFATECVVNGGGFGYVPGLLGRYRRHPQNATQRHAALRWEERHVGLALLEAEYPEYVGVWERARAYAHYQRAVEFVQQGLGAEARLAIAAAMRHDPAVSFKLPLWWAASFAPRSMLPRRMRGAAPSVS
ncbi:MAG TPA: hypothetical protein VMF89_22070, partial [Polyangiales bacterium]|nr:hypothetical protein [Polyangiales bacterium]